MMRLKYCLSTASAPLTRGIVRGPLGSMYVGGLVEPSDTGSATLVEKRRADGSLAWRVLFSWPDPSEARAGPLVLDGTTCLFVAGALETTNALGFIDAVVLGCKP